MVASVSGLSSAAVAANYYGKDNYYAQDEVTRDPSSWAGKGADALGLKGEVALEDFQSVLEGKLPDGSTIGAREGESQEATEARSHRPGIDLTFSPPKDVSLLAYISGDKRVIEAHEKAVDATLKWAEKNLAGTRIRKEDPSSDKGQKEPEPVQKGGEGKGANKNPAIPVRTGNLIIAKFQHDISRDQDPQLHTHCVIANATKSEDGKWRALHNDPFFEQRKTLSLIYDAHTRENLRAVGYAVSLDNGKTGEYSIVGVPDKAKQEFSQRTEKINAVADTLENPTPAAIKKVSLKTRPSKTQVSKEEKHADWQHRAKPWKATLDSVVAHSRSVVKEGRQEQLLDTTRPQKGLEETLTRWAQNYFRPTKTLSLQKDDPYKLNRGASEREYAARAAVSFALRHHEERDASFSLHNVRRTALEHGADGLTIRDLDKQIRLLRNRERIHLDVKDPHAESTTARSISNEVRTQNLVANAGKSAPISNSAMVDHRLRDTGLNDGQRGAVKMVLTSDQRLIGIQGYAGTGKTTMMRSASVLSEDLARAKSAKSVNILGLAPTHSAVRSLEQGLGHKTQTIQAFMIEQSRGTGPTSLKDTIVVIDESSFLSTKNMNQILQRLIDLNARKIVLSGDKRQHGAIEAGRPFDIAQRAGMQTATLKDVVRLQPRDESGSEKSRIANRREAVTEAGTGKVVNAIRRLSTNMHQAPIGLNSDELKKWMTNKALEMSRSFDPHRNDGTMFIAQSHYQRGLLNTEIRRELLAENKLGQEETIIKTLRARDMTKTEALSGRTYETGDILAFHGRNKATNAYPGNRRTVERINESKGTVTLSDSRGHTKTVTLKSLAGSKDWISYSLNRQESLSLREHDKLLFTRSHKEAGIAAHDQAIVKSFDKKTVTLTMDGKDRVFQRSEPALQSLTHGYAITSHAAQGKTAQNVVTLQDSREKLLTSQVGFYTDVSRSADNLAVITNDKQGLQNQLLLNTGLNVSALDTAKKIGEISGLNKPAAGLAPSEERGQTSSLDNQTSQGVDQSEGKTPQDQTKEIDMGIEFSL